MVQSMPLQFGPFGAKKANFWPQPPQYLFKAPKQRKTVVSNVLKNFILNQALCCASIEELHKLNNFVVQKDFF